MHRILALLLATCAGSASAQQFCTTQAPCSIRIFHVTSTGARAAYGCATTTCPAIETAINTQVVRLNDAWTTSQITNIVAINAGVYHSRNPFYDSHDSAQVAARIFQDPQTVPLRNTYTANMTIAIKAGPGGDSTANCIGPGTGPRSWMCGGIAVDVSQMLADRNTYQHEVGHPFGSEHETGAGGGAAFWWRTLEPCPQGAGQTCSDLRATKCYHTIGTEGGLMPTSASPQQCGAGWQKGWQSGTPWTCSPKEWCDDKAIQYRAIYAPPFGFPAYGVVTHAPSTKRCDPMGFNAQTQTIQIMGGVTIDMGPGQAVTIPSSQYQVCNSVNTTALLQFSNPSVRINDMPTGRPALADAATKFINSAPFVANWKTIPAPIPLVPLLK